MRHLIIGLLFSLWLPALAVQAQENACDLDVSGVIALLEKAQARASDNDAGGARELLRDAAEQITALADGCQGDIEITEQKTLLFDDGGPIAELTFNYPAGWLTAEERGNFPNILIGSNASALAKRLDNSQPPPFASGEVLIALGIASTRDMGASVDLGKSPTPAAFIEKLVSTVDDTLGKPSEPTVRAINDHPAAWATIPGNTFNLLLMLVDMNVKTPDEGTQYVLMIAISAPGEMEGLQPTLEAMAASIRLK